MKIAAIVFLALSLTSVTAVSRVSVRNSSEKGGRRGGAGVAGGKDEKDGKNGKDGKKDGKGGSNDGNCTYAEEVCAICDQCNKVRPDALKFRYNSAGVNSVYQPADKASCREGTYPNPASITAVSSKDPNVVYFSGNVNNGEEFEIFPPEGEEFEAETNFIIEGWGGGIGDDSPDTCFIHTSCSVPLVRNDQIGPLTVLAGTGCDEEIGTCVTVDKEMYECGDNITVSFDFEYPENSEGELGALDDDWIGIYPCIVGTEYDNPPDKGTYPYLHPEVWLWTCPEEYGDNFMSCGGVAKSDGNITFASPIPDYNAFGGYRWPVAPYHKIADELDSPINTCFKAVLLRYDGPSVPPYNKVCESPPFTINAGTTEECQVRGSSRSQPPPVPF